MIGAMPPRPVTRSIGEPAGASAVPTRQIDSTTLLSGQRELIIVHGLDHYRLRLTSKGKLILTK
jgi:hemin uptake protein HemP